MLCAEGHERSAGYRARQAVAAQVAANARLELDLVPIKTVKLHLLGDAGVGKTALRLSLAKTRIGRMFSSSGSSEASNTRPTLGVSVETFQLPNFSGNVSGVNVSCSSIQRSEAKRNETKRQKKI